MSDSWPPFWAGFVWAIILFGILLHLPFTVNSEAKVAIEECEKNLPINQHCKITAISEASA